MRKEDLTTVIRLYERYQGKALGYACRFVKRDVAEDIVQDVFLELAENIHSKALIIDNDRVVGLLTIMIRHRCINHLTKKKATLSLDAYEKDTIKDKANIEGDMMAKCRLESLEKCMADALTTMQKDVLYLRAEGYSHKEIGRLIQKNESAVRQLYKRARENAKKIVRRWDDHAIK